MSKKIYIYPLSSRDKNLGLYNPYIDDLIHAVEKNYTFINKDKPAKTGIFDLLKYIGRVDFIFFNWIEKLPTNKGGKIQSALLFPILFIFKMLGTKVVWTMHNKLSHSGEHQESTLKIFDGMLRKADFIITHSTEGIRFGCERIPGIENKFIYFPHPVKDRRLKTRTTKTTDLLIWGTISPYKGIDSFLKFLFDHKLQNEFSIRIVGKSTSKAYFNQLKKYENEHIQIQNMFIEDKDLQQMIAESRLILFTYSKDSILSSGVLMDSLGFGANILGPSVGAFADLAKEHIIETFLDKNDLSKKIKKTLQADEPSRQAILKSFLIEHTWDKFAAHIHKQLN